MEYIETNYILGETDALTLLLMGCFLSLSLRGGGACFCEKLKNFRIYMGVRDLGGSDWLVSRIGGCVVGRALKQDLVGSGHEAKVTSLNVPVETSVITAGVIPAGQHVVACHWSVQNLFARYTPIWGQNGFLQDNRADSIILLRTSCDVYASCSAATPTPHRGESPGRIWGEAGPASFCWH